MTPTPPSTNSSTGARSPEDQFRVVRKRNRVPLSCYPCRTRKKCDRSHPCSNCMKREAGDASACSYATPSSRKRSQAQADATPDDMQNRIDRLEGLVLSLMHGGANVDPASAASAGVAAVNAASATTAASGTSRTDGAKQGSQSATDSSWSRMDQEGGAVLEDDESDVEDTLASSLGFLKMDPEKGKAMYIGQEHWHTLLADITEVKNYFTYHKKELETSWERVKQSKPVLSQTGPTLLLGAVPAAEEELRAALPPKATILTLCTRYFNSMDNAVNIIHGPTFQQQLRGHWQDPSKTPLSWLGMLYSILCLAMISYHKVGDEPPEWKGRSLDLSGEYRLRTVQCLVTSDYTKPTDFTVETLLMYIFGEYSTRWDAEMPLWMIVSLVVRLAYRQGFHRDAKWFPMISPFQAEMRRRIWAMVRMADVVFSHQVSLPSMIDEHNCDTQLPNNIFDDEIYPEMTSAPAPRPNTEPTPIAYMIAKARLCNEMGNMLQSTNRIGAHVTYDEIIRYDARLRQVMHELPPHLKITRMDGQPSPDPVNLVIARFNIDILYLKIMCILHRKYIPRARTNPRYAHSRRSAIEASLTALDHLAVLHRESQPNGKLRSVKWFIKSIATRDFVLPAVLIVLDLHFDNVSLETNAPSDGEGNYLWNPEQRSRMIRALETAQAIWKSLADTSMEAFKASKVLEIMLEKARNPATAAVPPPGTSTSTGSRTDSMSTLANSLGLGPSPAVSTDSTSPPKNEFSDWNPSANTFSPTNASAFPGMDLGMNTTMDMPLGSLAMGGAPSPFSAMLGNGGGGADLTGGNFDWGALENYAQTTNWGADQSFQIYGYDGEQGDGNPAAGESMNLQ